MFKISDCYNVETYPIGTTLGECDTFLIGENHYDESHYEACRKTIDKYGTSDSVLLLEGIPSLLNSIPSFTEKASSEYCEIFINNRIKRYLSDSVDNMHILGWDNLDYIEKNRPFYENLLYIIKFMGDKFSANKKVVDEIASCFFTKMHSVYKVNYDYFNIVSQACDYLKQPVFMPHLEEISCLFQSNVNELACDIQLLFSYSNSLNYDRVEGIIGCRCSDEIIFKIKRTLIDPLCSKIFRNIDYIHGKIGVFMGNRIKEIEESALVRNLSMVETIKKIHENSEFKKCFLISGVIHLYQNLDSLGFNKSDIDPLYSYIKSCEKKVAVLIPKKFI